MSLKLFGRFVQVIWWDTMSFGTGDCTAQIDGQIEPIYLSLCIGLLEVRVWSKKWSREV